METLQVFLRTTVYITSMLAIGYSLKAYGLLERNGNSLFKYVMYVAMPALAVESLSGVEAEPGLLMTSLIYFFSMSILSFSIILFGWFIGYERSRTYLLALAANFSNTGFFGIPFMIVVFGEASIRLSILLWMITFIYSTFLCIPLLESLRESSRNFRKLVERTLKNPLIISVTLGMTLSLLKLSPPEEVSYILKSLGATASPLALISIGASISSFKAVSLRNQGLLLFLKAFLSPAISLLLGLIAKLNYIELCSLVLMSAMPAAVFLGVFSNEYDFHREEIFPFITISSLTAPFYLNIWLYFLNSFLA